MGSNCPIDGKLDSIIGSARRLDSDTLCPTEKQKCWSFTFWVDPVTVVSNPVVRAAVQVGAFECPLPKLSLMTN